MSKIKISNMTDRDKQIRDKQIRKAAKSYFDKIYDAEKNCRDYKGSAYDEGFLDVLDPAVETAFIDGAMCADDHAEEVLRRQVTQIVKEYLLIKPSRK
jgi:hypothetical protein